MGWFLSCVFDSSNKLILIKLEKLNIFFNVGNNATPVAISISLSAFSTYFHLA